jgi:hypothetical protein
MARLPPPQISTLSGAKKRRGGGPFFFKFFAPICSYSYSCSRKVEKINFINQIKKKGQKKTKKKKKRTWVGPNEKKNILKNPSRFFIPPCASSILREKKNFFFRGPESSYSL